MIFIIYYLPTIYEYFSIFQISINTIVSPFCIHILINRSPDEMKHYKILYSNVIFSTYLIGVSAGVLHPSFLYTPNFTVLLPKIIYVNENIYRSALIIVLFILILA